MARMMALSDRLAFHTTPQAVPGAKSARTSVLPAIQPLLIAPVPAAYGAGRRKAHGLTILLTTSHDAFFTPH